MLYSMLLKVIKCHIKTAEINIYILTQVSKRINSSNYLSVTTVLDSHL